MRHLTWPAVLATTFLAFCSNELAHSNSAIASGDDSPYVVNIGPQLPGQVWNQPYEAIFTNAQDAGVGWAFIFVTWSDVERVPGQIGLSGLDQVVISAHSHKVNL